MATRSPAPPRPRASRSGTSPTSRSSKSAPAKPRSASTRPAPAAARRRPAPAGPSPLSRLFSGLAAALAAVWVGIGHVVGGTVRKLGNGARDLDPAHRRDGLGLVIIGGAILVAFAVWWDVTSGLGSLVGSLVTGALGSLDWVLPLLLLGLAWRVLRHPDQSAATGRVTIGWGAIVLVGLRARARRRTARRCRRTASAAMSSGGGWVGWIASAPVVAATHPVVAGLLLVLLFVFGVLVVTATPVAAVPERLRYVRDRVLGRVPVETPEGVATGETTTRRGRRKAAADAARADRSRRARGRRRLRDAAGRRRPAQARPSSRRGERRRPTPPRR